MLVYGKCECFVMQMLYACVLRASRVMNDMQSAHSRAGPITSPYVAMSVSPCLPHPTAASAPPMIC